VFEPPFVPGPVGEIDTNRSVCFNGLVPSTRRPQARAQRTRQQIIEAAATAFAARGFEGVALNDIVRASGLTKGAFYFHFASKEELALAAFRAKQEELLGRLTGERGGAVAGAGQGAGALEALAALLRRRAELLAADPSLRCVTRLGGDLMTRYGPGSEFGEFQELALDLIGGLLARGQREGCIRRDLPPRQAAETIFAAIVGIDQLSQLMSHGEDLPRRTGELLGLLIPALAAPAASSADLPRNQHCQ
jgi:AcrR family transcriptional regulator